MTRLSQLRSKLFAYKLTSSISDNFLGSDKVDALLTEARLGYETMLSTASGERVDQRRSASRGQVIYRQSIVAPTSVVLVLDITSNWQYQHKILQQINIIINHTITSCEQLGLECIIIHPHNGEIVEHVCEGLETTINHLNTIIYHKHIQPSSAFFSLLQLIYTEYYDHHTIIISDRFSRDSEHDGSLPSRAYTADKTQAIIHNGQALGYIRDYPSPIVQRGSIPQGLIWLKS